MIGGKAYIFDPQRDYRMSANATQAIPYLYFGISYENAWRYTQETDANEARDAQFLPVEEERKVEAVVHATATQSGTAGGSGTYEIGESVTVTATGLNDFLGWYDEKGVLLSTNLSYTFTAQRSITLLAVFEGELFSDISSKTWYRYDAMEAALRGIVNGTEPFLFDGGKTLTRAMAVTIIARAAKAESASSEFPFEDVKENAWFAPALAWAYENHIAKGTKPTLFAPDEPVTREQFVTMLLRYADFAGLSMESAELDYTDVDQISDYAVETMAQAQALDLLTGYPDGSIAPKKLLTRAEGVTLLMRLLRKIEAN